MGTRYAGPPPQKRAEAADGSYPRQVLGSVRRPRRHLAFRERHALRGAQSYNASRERGSASGPQISRFGWQLPLSRVPRARGVVRVSDSSFRDSSILPWHAIRSSVVFENLLGCRCFQQVCWRTLFFESVLKLIMHRLTHWPLISFVP